MTLIAVDVAGEQTYFPGMVNLSGTLCYMNSVLQVRSPFSTSGRYTSANAQAFASVTSLLSHLERIVNFAVEVDLPTPVSDALLTILYGAFPPVWFHLRLF